MMASQDSDSTRDGAVAISPQVKNKLDYWKQRLVDLSRRNRLLYFRPSQHRTLFIQEPSSQAVFERLVDEKPWNIFLPPASDEVLPEMYQEFRSPQEGRPRQDEFVTDVTDRDRLERVLLNLYRLSYTDYQERGVRILHVAVGLVKWRETRESEFVASPLLLVPVELVRADARSRMSLAPTEEDIVVNPALEIKLRTDFNIVLPEPPENWENGNLGEYFNAVKAAFDDKAWDVEEKALIDLFSFHKLVIYRDLAANAASIAGNSIIKGLARESSIRVDHDAIPGEDEVDSLHNPEEPFQILDADSSQQVCIQAALRGTSFVMQGPPGTGKSQTIANMIAEFIARGKTVLFVSEKMAALEVVSQRLVGRGLHDFCFELHSHKKSKRDVVEELDRCISERPNARGSMTANEAAVLKRRRADLLEYIEALHKPRGKAGWTAYGILGELAESHDVSSYSLEMPGIKDISAENLADLLSIVSRLKHVWLVVEEGDSFPWVRCTKRTLGLREKQLMQQTITDLQDSLEQLQRQAEVVADALGLPAPSDMDGSAWLLRACQLAEVSPVPARNWLIGDDLRALKEDAEAYCTAMQHYRDEHDQLQSIYGDAIFATGADAYQAVQADVDRLAQLLHTDVSTSETVFAQRDIVEKFAEFSQVLGKDCLRNIQELADLFGCDPGDRTFGRMEDLAELAQLCGGEDRPDPSWLSLNTITSIKRGLPDVAAEIGKHNDLWAQLQDTYDEAFLGLDLDHLIEEFSGAYNWPIKWVLPRYYKAKSAILSVTRTGSLPKTVAKDLTIAREVLRLRNRIDPLLPSLEGTLGWYYKGYATDFDQVERALGRAERAMVLLGMREAQSKAVALLSVTEPESPHIQERGQRIKSSLAQWTQFSSQMPFAIPLADLVQDNNVHVRQVSLSRLSDWADEYADCISKINRITADCCAADKGVPVSSFGALAADLERRSKLSEVDAMIEQESARLQSHFGRRYRGFDTDWQDILAALDWSWQVVQHFGDRTIPSTFVDRCTSTDLGWQCSEEYDRCLHSYTMELAGLCASFSDGYPKIDGCGCNGASFAAVSGLVSTLEQRIDDLQLWIDYRNIEEEAQEAGLSGFISEATRRLPAPERLEDILLKSVYSEWLDAVYKDDKVLRQFRRTTHEALIDEFRSLDLQMIGAATAAIVANAAGRRPAAASAAIGGSETSVIRREAKKKSRHLPVRKLFKAIPTALTQLKPCLLMSPLSVSQFLDPEQHRFDVVIFDEASQVSPWDAVGAIYRGNQLIVAGDNMQLPPTSFFERVVSDDADADEEDDSTADFESILDECGSIGLPEMMLRWHYRSRHESLIAFSNHWFYDNKLVTFPSSTDEADDLGVRFEFVQDGIYNRGQSKNNNPVEAERVADLVFRHFRERPDRTLGVVAFSKAQMKTILDAIEKRRREHREFDSCFTDDRLKGFFVKNLEEVQGDERDVLIFSVGYGRDSLGRMSNNFGPINRQGGERRLNVQVTRAKEMVIVVSSIRAEDIDVKGNLPTGALMLHHYLDYAENGISVLERSLTYSDGEAESPLEADIAAAIRGMGYEYVHQVGCSSYRIDIGVFDPDKPGRYALGVECDGAMYHSARSARDRDRLRQSVLENLGWRIHRIWSPDWVSRRDTELAKLKQAIESAREAGSRINVPPAEQDAAQQPPEQADSPVFYDRQDVPEDYDISNIDGAEPYCLCALPRVSWFAPDFTHYVNQPSIKRLITELLETEAPAHVDYVAKRIATEYGAKKVGSKIREAVQIAVNGCKTQGLVRQDGEFLWPQRQSRTAVRVPTDDEATHRPLDWICDDEIKAAMCLIVKQCGSVSEDALVTLCARLYGFQRTGRTIDERLRGILLDLLDSRQLSIVGSSVTLTC